MFGIANQLLSSVALRVGTAVILNAGRARCAWVTPGCPDLRVEHPLYAASRSIFDNFFPMAQQPGKAFTGHLDAVLAALLMSCVGLILVALDAGLAARPPPGEPVSMAAVAAGATSTGPDGSC